MNGTCLTSSYSVANSEGCGQPVLPLPVQFQSGQNLITLQSAACLLITLAYEYSGYFTLLGKDF
jgi:hypothetical protein